MFDGIYSYRFDGFSVDDAVPHFLVGVGTMTLDKNKGTITGTHWSASSQLTGLAGLNDAFFDAVAFGFEGEFSEDRSLEAKGRGGLWQARIKFTSLDEPDPVTGVRRGGAPTKMTGWFALVPVGDSERFWLISVGARREAKTVAEKLAGTIIDEVVKGEAVRLSARSA